jgi:PPOX class probable F420-dependent enzyme
VERPGRSEHSELFGRHARGALTTLKRDGRPQLSVVDFTCDDERSIARLSTTADRAKAHNLRRDPRASLFVATGNYARYAVAEGTVELSAVAVAKDDEAVDELVEIYRLMVGEHPDWEDYRRAMIADRRLVVRLHIGRFYGAG